MQLSVLDVISAAGGHTNEDRAGFVETCAWVIDGATDVIDAPLNRETSDAAWFAAAMDEELDAWARSGAPGDLAHLPNKLAHRLDTRFRTAAQRAPSGPDEQPSAAAMIVRLEHKRLTYVTLGDCALILEQGGVDGGLLHIGDVIERAGDQWVAKAIEEERQKLAPAASLSLRQSLWPRLRQARRAMNDPAGYGIFSITPTPGHFVRSGAIDLDGPVKGLICSDGLMRFVDVMRRYTVEELFAAATDRGLAALVAELRSLETADETCFTYPRAKQFDDTTAILFEIA